MPTRPGRRVGSWCTLLLLGQHAQAHPWVQDVCPETAAMISARSSPSLHRAHSASGTRHRVSRQRFRRRYAVDTSGLCRQATQAAAQSVCTLLMVQALALASGHELYLHGDTLVDALTDGKPTRSKPCLSALLSHDARQLFLSECARVSGSVHKNAALHCQAEKQTIKVWADTRDTACDRPCVDVHLFRTDHAHMWEVDSGGDRLGESWPLDSFFPCRPYSFGGGLFMGPRTEGTGKARTRAATVGPLAAPLSAAGENVTDLPWHTSIAQRRAWAREPAWRGQELTAAIPHLDEVEVDNTFAGKDECTAPVNGILTVIEFNAERGRHWLAALPLLRGADIIILNEMDIGMARSGQQHTTRWLARALGMNYAWGLEFVELTGGTREEQRGVGATPNFAGLHGNAFLTRCRIRDAVVFRDGVGPYFDDAANAVNADGYERRLGGRMGMFARVTVGGHTLTIGSTHKLKGHDAAVRAYIGADKAVTAGDQDRAFCARVGLQNVDNASTPTWPATCTSFGRGRGDNVCSNLRVAVPDTAALPCFEKFGARGLLSDHAVVRVGLQL